MVIIEVKTKNNSIYQFSKENCTYRKISSSQDWQKMLQFPIIEMGKSVNIKMPHKKYNFYNIHTSTVISIEEISCES